MALRTGRHFVLFLILLPRLLLSFRPSSGRLVLQHFGKFRAVNGVLRSLLVTDKNPWECSVEMQVVGI